MDTPTFAALAAISALAGLAKGLTGFGAALIMAPLFALVVSPAQAAVFIVLLHGLTAWQGIRRHVELVEWWRVSVLAAIALLCHQLSLDLVTQFDPHLLRRGVGALVLVMGVLAWIGVQIRHRGGHVPTTLAGATSGLFTAIGGLGGPPVVYYFSGRGGSAPAVRANLLAYFMLLFSGASLGLLVHGQLNWSALRSSLLLVPFFCAGAIVGEALFARLPSARFARVVQLALIAIGIFTLAS